MYFTVLCAAVYCNQHKRVVFHIPLRLISRRLQLLRAINTALSLQCRTRYTIRSAIKKTVAQYAERHRQSWNVAKLCMYDRYCGYGLTFR